MKPLLFIFSLISRLVLRIKNCLYDRGLFKAQRAPLPVISIGNIALGGTEKTPLAMEVVNRLLARGRRPALISRGYKGRWERKGGVVSEGRGLLGGWEDSGDEPYLVARSIPSIGVYVGKDRLTSCRRAAAAGFDIAVLDDAFQHRRLVRDLDIVLFSPAERIALRESRSALRRTDVLLIKDNEAGRKAGVELGLRGPKIVTYSVTPRRWVDLWTEEIVSRERLEKKRVLAFCGIARPARFLEQLGAMGCEVVSFLPFSDHHPYPRASLEKIVRASRRAEADALVTTEKDGLKLAGRQEELAGLPVYLLRIGLLLGPQFDSVLDDVIKRHPTV